MTPKFDSEGCDRTTFAPFVLHDCRETEWKDVRLEFSDWDWLHDFCGGDRIDDYYLNGPGVEGLVMAARLLNGLEPVAGTMDPNSEGDACYLHFNDLDEALRTATLSAATLKDKALLRQAVATAQENGFGG
jgi:hypothetical protein